MGGGGDGGWVIKADGGLLERQKRRHELPMSCSFNFFSFFSSFPPSRSSLVGWTSLVWRWAGLPPPLESLCPRAIHLNFNERQLSCEDLKTGIFGRLLEVPGLASFAWCDVKLTFVWWFHTYCGNKLGSSAGWNSTPFSRRSPLYPPLFFFFWWLNLTPNDNRRLLN